MTQTLKQDIVGQLAYNIYVDGELKESVSVDDPMEYLHGHENIVPGLEKALDGLAVGASFDVTVQPAEAYGEYDEDDIDDLPRDEFDFEEEGAEPEAGFEVEMMDEDGDIYVGTIIEVSDDTVTVDFNHELAGKAIRYQGTIVGVREATEEELEWGFPETLLDEMFGDDDIYEDDEE